MDPFGGVVCTAWIQALLIIPESSRRHALPYDDAIPPCTGGNIWIAPARGQISTFNRNEDDIDVYHCRQNIQYA